MRSIGTAAILLALFASCRPASQPAEAPPAAGPARPDGDLPVAPSRTPSQSGSSQSGDNAAAAAPAGAVSPDSPGAGPADRDRNRDVMPSSSGNASDGDAPPAAVASALLEERAGLVRLSPVGGLWIDPKGREVIVSAKVVLTEGPIELFACPAKTKEYESILAIDPLEARLDPPTIDAMASLLGVDPKAFEQRVGARLGPAELIHTALVLIGLAPGRPVAFVPEYRAATGSAVRVRVRFRAADGTVETADARDWIRDIRSGEAMASGWVFAGSGFSRHSDTDEDRYEADAGDCICVSNFQTAMLDLPVPSAQSNEALVFEIMPGRVPAKGTPVEIVLSADPSAGAGSPVSTAGPAVTSADPEPREPPPQVRRDP